MAQAVLVDLSGVAAALRTEEALVDMAHVRRVLDAVAAQQREAHEEQDRRERPRQIDHEYPQQRRAVTLRDDLVRKVYESAVRERAAGGQRDVNVPPRFLRSGGECVHRRGVERPEEDRVERAANAEPERQVQEDGVERVGVEEPEAIDQVTLAALGPQTLPAAHVHNVRLEEPGDEQEHAKRAKEEGVEPPHGSRSANPSPHGQPDCECEDDEAEARDHGDGDRVSGRVGRHSSLPARARHGLQVAASSPGTVTSGK